MTFQAGWTEHAHLSHEVPCPTCGRSIAVYSVDGFWVRNQIDVGFVGGAHDLVDDWLPDHAIALERMIEPRDERCFEIHESTERAKMERGLSYNRAHHFANELEAEARRKSFGVPAPHRGDT